MFLYRLTSKWTIEALIVLFKALIKSFSEFYVIFDKALDIPNAHIKYAIIIFDLSSHLLTFFAVPNVYQRF